MYRMSLQHLLSRVSSLLLFAALAMPGSQALAADCNSNGIDDLLEFDSDGDGIINACDNCSRVANPQQIDSDNDGFGNYCDADLDNSGNVSFNDLALFKAAFNSTDIHADFNGNGRVTFNDLALFKAMFNRAPGPGANPNDSDDDADGVIDSEDNCPGLSNPDQTDRDGDGVGNACDSSPYGSGVSLEFYGIDQELPSVIHFLTRAVSRSDGNAINDLSAADFLVSEDGQAVSAPEAFLQLRRSADISPQQLHTVLLIDIGRSISAEDIDRIKIAAKNTIRDSLSGTSRLLDGQTLALYTFDETLQLLQAATSDVELLSTAIDGISRGSLSTNLFGAVYEVLDDWQNRVSLHQGLEFGALILVTDGEDSAALTSLADVQQRAASQAIHAIAVGPNANQQQLQAFANTVSPIADYSQLEVALAIAMQWATDFSSDLYDIYYASSKRSGEHSVELQITDNPDCGSDEIACRTVLNGSLIADGFSDVSPEILITGERLVSAGDIVEWSARTLWSNDPVNYSWTLSDYFNRVTLNQNSIDPARATLVVSNENDYVLADITVTDLNYADVSRTETLRAGNGIIIQADGKNTGLIHFDWESTDSLSMHAAFAEPPGNDPDFAWSIDQPGAGRFTSAGASPDGLDASGATVTLERSTPSSTEVNAVLTVTDTVSGTAHSIPLRNLSYFVPYPETIMAGGLYSCGFDLPGAALLCWGDNQYGQTDVPPLTNPVMFATARQHACAIDDNGLSCWGYNGDGQIDVPLLSNPHYVAAGNQNTCAIDDNGVQCWGIDVHGQTQVPVLNNPHSVTIGGLHLCALDDDGVKCWGYNGFGETDVPALNQPGMIAAGYRHTCALDNDGVVCWGYNGNGQLNVPTLSNPYELVSGRLHSCALDDQGLHCWGDNSKGQSTVPNLENPYKVIAGAEHTCALDDAGMHCWGSNEQGQLDIPALWGWQ